MREETSVSKGTSPPTAFEAVAATKVIGAEEPRPFIISVKPEYAEAILAGEKTLEIRKNRAVALAGRLGYIYASAPTSAVIGDFRVAAVEVARLCGDFREHDRRVAQLWERWGERAAIGKSAFERYLRGWTKWTCALSIAEPRRHERMLVVGDAASSAEIVGAHLSIIPPQSWRYAKDGELASLHRSRSFSWETQQ